MKLLYYASVKGMKMKIFTVFSITFVLMACLFAGCGGDEDELVGPGGAEGEYLAFAAMKPGSWAEHTDPDGASDKYKFLGEDTWEGSSCFVIELETTSDEDLSVTQVWLDKATAEIVLFLIRMDGKVMKMDLSGSAELDVPGDEPPSETSDIKDLGADTYTTPTNKTVNVRKYSEGNNEFWTSSEVPFSEVQDKLNGEPVSWLYDFGLSGASRTISKQEAENAEPFDILGGLPGNGGIPDEPGGSEQEGDIIITIGPGARPEFQVSKPIRLFIITSPGFIWSFRCIDDQTPSLPGPFQYGVLPDNANLVGPDNPPDLVVGQTYQVQVIGDIEGWLPLMGTLQFTR